MAANYGPAYARGRHQIHRQAVKFVREPFLGWDESKIGRELGGR